jgi:D-3-phosphoglycerate dehydrogenase
MSSLKVSLITSDKKDIPAWVVEELENSGIDLTAKKCKSAQDLIATAKDANVIWTQGKNETLTPELLPEFKNCKAIMRSGSGLDDMPVEAAKKLGIKVLNTPEAIAETVAEHAVALLFALTRQLPQHDKAAKNGKWDSGASWAKWHVVGQTLGLIGFGLIARHVAKMLKGFDMRLLVYDPYVDPKFLSEFGAEQCSREKLFKEADFLSVHSPLNEETRHSIGCNEFKMMKKNALLINTSRGAVIDEEALINALKNGEIAGAGLDVTEEEPPAKDNPLLGMDNVIITPHIAAFSDEFTYKFWKASIEKLKGEIKK